MNRGCNHEFMWAMFAHRGGRGTRTVQGAYSARNGSHVIAARIPSLSKAAIRHSVKTSVPVPALIAGNQTAGVGWSLPSMWVDRSRGWLALRGNVPASIRSLSGFSGNSKEMTCVASKAKGSKPETTVSRDLHCLSFPCVGRTATSSVTPPYGSPLACLTGFPQYPKVGWH